MLLEEKMTLGKAISNHRNLRGMSMAELARKIRTNRSYIYKVENNSLKPSKERIEEIADVLQLQQNERFELLDLANISGKTNQYREEVKTNMESISTQEKKVRVNVPSGLQVLYTDTAFVTSRPFGITIDFAQFVGPTEQQNVVSRIGMSVDHAEAFISVLKKKISEAKLLSKSSKPHEDKN